MKAIKNIKILNIILHSYIAISSLTIMILGVCGAFSKDAFQNNEGFLSYFTTLSNIYAGVVSLMVAIFYVYKFRQQEVIMPRWLKIITLTASSGVTLTFLTTTFFLGPTFVINGYNYFSLFEGYLFIYHFFNPVLFLLTYIFLNRGPKLNFKEVILGILPMLIYASVYTPLVLTGIWIDFYGFTFGGHAWAAFISLPVVILVTFAISYFTNLAADKFQKL